MADTQWKSEKQRWTELNEEVNILTKQRKKLYNEVVNIQNPYNKEKQYVEWAAVENVLDIIIRSDIYQTVKEELGK
jgi:hypothetical protein